MADNQDEISDKISDKIGEMSSGHWDLLDELASKLESAWKAGGATDLMPLLPPATSPLRKHALEELVKVDLECRWRRGQAVVLDYYVDKYPELGKTRDLPPSLICEEYRVRHLFGDKPPLTLYKSRFPAQYDEMRAILEQEPLPTMVQLKTIVPPPPKKPTKKEMSKTAAEGFETTPAAAATAKTFVAVGEYRLLERLGAGAFGEVYRAEMPGGIMKAVKIISRPLDHDEAKRELEALELIKAMRHHFLLQTISYRSSEDRLYILMDLADHSLRDLLKKNKKAGTPGIPLPDIARYLSEAAEALDYLHEKGVQHRDIKPENILLSEGIVRVADFGLARQQGSRKLVSGSGAGTPVYMPPEAWQDKVHANSDQYSLAATYAECRLGRRIYQCEGLAAVMHAHIHDTPDLGPLPADEKKVLLRALAKKPDDRYPTCSAFAIDLIRAVAKTLPPGSFKGMIPAEPNTATRRALARQKRIQTAITVFGLLGLLVMGSVIAILLAQSGPRLPDPAAAGPFRAAPGTPVVSIHGKPYYKQIDCLVGGDPEKAVRFNLVPTTEKGKSPFYLMENKISNDTYGSFATANPSAVNGSRWRLGARSQDSLTAALYPTVALVGGFPATFNLPAARVLGDGRANAVFFQNDWPQPDDLGAGEKTWPVLRVDVQEAHRCAEWLGGVLPSADEWDKAAGRFEPDRGPGPYQSSPGPGDIAVGLEAPRPIGTAAKDISSVSGCRDMAGNGLEWTRSLRSDGNASEYLGHLAAVDPLAKVAIRGRSYKSPDPLTYDEMEKRPIDLEFFETTRTQGYDPVTGFRVAILP